MSDVLNRPGFWGGHKDFESALAAYPASKDRARVYFIEARGTGLVKVGFTNSLVEDRLESLACASPFELRVLATMAGGFAEEQALHQRFADQRVRGEWFRNDGELAELIAELVRTA
jgi:hypothetical protein